MWREESPEIAHAVLGTEIAAGYKLLNEHASRIQTKKLRFILQDATVHGSKTKGNDHILSVGDDREQET